MVKEFLPESWFQLDVHNKFYVVHSENEGKRKKWVEQIFFMFKWYAKA
jgi:hypothetical protein